MARTPKSSSFQRTVPVTDDDAVLGTEDAPIHIAYASVTSEAVLDALAENEDPIAVNGVAITDLLDPTDDQDADTLVARNTAISTSTVTIVGAGHVRYTAPIAAELVSVVNAVEPADGTLTIAAQPDFPRKLQVRIVDTDESIETGTITLVGVGARGQAVTQEIPLTGGTQTVITDEAFATLTSATVADLTGTVTGDTVGIGVGAALGLPAPMTPTPGTFVVYKSNADEADEAVGTVDADAGTIIPTTVPDGAVNFDFWFNYTITPGVDLAP